MPATPRTIEITEEDLNRPVHSSPGLTPDELAEAFDRIYWGEEIMEIPEPSYLLDEYLPRGALVFVSAHGQSGKSLLVLAWAQCVARGHAWSGREVLNPGKVLYLTQEGVNSFKHRILAFQKQRGYVDWTPQFGLMPKTMSLGVRTDRDGNVQEGENWPELEALIREHRPVMVVIDPYADYFRPGQENNNDDAKAWVNKARRLLASLGEEAPTLVVPAHTPKGNEKGGEMRGASALYDGADRVYTITSLFPIEDSTAGYSSRSDLIGMKLSCEKSKDGGRPDVWFGEVHEVELEGGLGGKSVMVDGCSKERWAELIDEAQNRHKVAQVDTTDALIRQRIIEAVRRNPGELWTRIKKEVKQGVRRADAAIQDIRDELLDEGVLYTEGSDRYSRYFVTEQEDPDEL